MREITIRVYERSDGFLILAPGAGVYDAVDLQSAADAMCRILEDTFHE